MRTIQDISDDIIMCADEQDGGRHDAHQYVDELIVALRSNVPPVPADSMLTTCPHCGCDCGIEMALLLRRNTPAAHAGPQAPPLDKEHEVSEGHPTRPVMVKVEIDVEIAPLVERLQRYFGISTFASCQGGPSYSAYVMVGWKDAASLERLQADFSVTVLSDGLGYVHPRCVAGPQAGPKCIACGEANDGGYEVENGPGPFCSDCWERLQDFFKGAGPQAGWQRDDVETILDGIGRLNIDADYQKLLADKVFRLAAPGVRPSQET